jgi:predicted deacylase
MLLPPFAQKTIEVGSAGALKIALPVLEFGSGNPRVLILAGLHGDEHTGLFVLRQLFRRLDLQQGTLSIIPAANPLAQSLDQREDPLGRKDPNRAFPGDFEKDFTQRLTATLFAQAKEHRDCVIDLHTLEMHSRLMAIFMNHGTRETRQKSLELIRVFAPDLIWQLDTSSSLGRRWGGSMGPTMANEGIINFAVEMATHDHVDSAEIDRAVGGILRVLAHLGMIAASPLPPPSAPLKFSYRDACVARTGLFEPRTEIVDAVCAGNFPTVAKDDLIGILTDPVTFEEYAVRSQYDGPVVAIVGREFVRTGDAIYNIGEVKPWQQLAQTTVSMIAKYGKAINPRVTDKTERLINIVDRLANDENADASICQAALWLSQLDSSTLINRNLAESFLRALSDVDDETRTRILDCLDLQAPDTPEARVVREVQRQIDGRSDQS